LIKKESCCAWLYYSCLIGNAREYVIERMEEKPNGEERNAKQAESFSGFNAFCK
jgi:hypothetical protein